MKEMEQRQKIRREFRSLRQSMGLSQGRLGRLMGMAAKHISAIETGERGRAPTRQQMAHIAAIKLVKEAGFISQLEEKTKKA